MPRVLFLYGSQACVPEDPLRAAKRLGCATVAFAAKPPCGPCEGLVDEFRAVDLGRREAVIAAADELRSGGGLDAVVAYDDQAAPVAAQVAAALGLPGNPVEAAESARDKVAMKRRFDASGVPCAPWKLAGDEDDAVAWAAAGGYPVVVKPVRGSASQGVSRADSEDELRGAYRRLRRLVVDQGLDTGGRPDAEQLVEGYLDGTEVSVELLLSAGEPNVLAVFDKPKPLTGPFFEETIYVAPGRLDPPQRGQVEDLAQCAVAALGLTTGAAHCEVRLTSSGPVVLEVGARLIGGACSRAFRWLVEDDLHAFLIRLALGERPPWPRSREGAAGAMMLPIPRQGRLQAVRGLEAARRIPGIVNVLITAKPGDVILEFPEQSCYIGFLTAAAADPEAVEQALVEAAASLDVEVEPLACLRLGREVEDHRDYTAPEGIQIRTLCGLPPAAVSEVVVPLIAASCYSELPEDLARTKARSCFDRLHQRASAHAAASSWLVAENAGVGFLQANGATCAGGCLGVIPPRHGDGVGEALVRSLLSLAARSGGTRMEVEVDPRQPRAVGLFRRLGFRESAGACEGCCGG